MLILQKVLQKQTVDIRFNDPSITRNSAHVDLKDKDLDNNSLVQLNSSPTVRERLTSKLNFHNAIKEPKLAGISQKIDFDNHSLTNLSIIF